MKNKPVLEFYGFLFIFLLTFLFVLSSGCGKSEWMGGYAEAPEAEMSNSETLAFKDSRSEDGFISDGDLRANTQAAGEGWLKQESPNEAEADIDSVSNDSGQDKKIYTGYQKLRVKNVEETKSKVIALTEQTGGYVERLYSNYIILRIPKALFTESFNTILNYGEVLDKSVQTFDVSEYFQDLSLRLDIALKSRNRLYALLEKTEDVKERLKILKEINRLSEEIEGINLRLESLKQLIAYSKITVEFVPRLSQDDSRLGDRIPFGWIKNLDAFQVSLPNLSGSLKLDLPDQFAEFTRSGYFHAETPDGTVIRAGSTKNTPQGDNDFWQEALAYHLGPLYEKAEKMDLGAYKAVLFTSRDREPFYYLVAVQVRDKNIRIMEIIFPAEEYKTDLLDDLSGRIKELDQ